MHGFSKVNRSGPVGTMDPGGHEHVKLELGVAAVMLGDPSIMVQAACGPHAEIQTSCTVKQSLPL